MQESPRSREGEQPGQPSFSPLFIVMAKAPRPGSVKTRLIDDRVDAVAAAEVAAAMTRCVLERLAAVGEVVLAVTPDDHLDDWPPGLVRCADRVLDQGPGDLGSRMARVWRAAAPDRPVAFFGIDSPDVPLDAIGRIIAALTESDIVIGPTHDGGYWTLAAAQHLPQVLECIDWGGREVYDATVARAEAHDLTVEELPVWHDVDTPDDLAALQARLRSAPDGGGETLRKLAARLNAILNTRETEGEAT